MDIKTRAKNAGDVVDEQHHMLQNLLASMPVGVAWADPGSGKIEFVNRKFTYLFGYELGDLTTIHDWIKNCYANPEQAKSIDAFWKSRLESESSANVEVEDVELDIRCKDGTIKTVLSGKILLPHNSGALATFLDITPRKEREGLISKQAMEDPLTGLLNRRAFTQILDRNLRNCLELGGTMALMLIDLDGFKPVNDSYGHDQGDTLLVKVAERLKHAVRENDALCRIGGDEFGVVLNSVSNLDTVVVVAERILYGLTRRPYELAGNSVNISASIGIALYPTMRNRSAIFSSTRTRRCTAPKTAARAAGAASGHGVGLTNPRSEFLLRHLLSSPVRLRYRARRWRSRVQPANR